MDEMSMYVDRTPFRPLRIAFINRKSIASMIDIQVRLISSSNASLLGVLSHSAAVALESSPPR